MKRDDMAQDSATPSQDSRRKLNRRGWTALALLLVVAAGAAGWYGYRQRHPEPVPVKLETVAAGRGDIEQVVNATGNVAMQSYVDVGTKVSGQISDVYVAIGELVKEGKLLVAISPAVQAGRLESNRAQMARLKAELAGQNAQLDFAQLQFQRQTQLKAENATREETYESSRMGMYSAAAKVDAINAQIQQLDATMKEDDAIQKQTKVVAPISGTVVALSARVGQTLSANQDVLMRIADLSRMSVQARVAEEDVTRLHKGMTAYFTTPGYPGKRWAGKLRQIMLLPADDSGRQGKKAFYTVLFDVPNPSRELMAGMTADVFFVLARVEHAVTIPASLVVKPDSKGLQKLKVLRPDGKLETREVKIGIRDADKAQVLSGLKEDEQVLLPATAPSARDKSGQ
ncbi:efflux RND transporter periplasmic adaptor subunit [Herbaspirillum sp. RV1423]|uniref:efflux RND transporter periplasmic adaptor subunit n=1 Tax=Herbaspirillum sp. RV1423 TaxID=1443993 RepID=UPI00068428B8|nr:efflux RND transporter periplasmic adaptor subunit [Herbaspirillum sp. RV1423]